MFAGLCLHNRPALKIICFVTVTHEKVYLPSVARCVEGIKKACDF